jgi:hypothetical protein
MIAMEEIRNKVKESGLIQLDLADFKPKHAPVVFDLKGALWQELIIREKEFRAFVKDHDWSQYEGKTVAVICSADAIVPTWAFMLVSTELTRHGVENYTHSPEWVYSMMVRKNIATLKTDDFKDGRVIIKGCSDILFPEFAMTELVKHLQPHVISIMYGEPCSTVPIYKRAKN